MVDVRTTLNHPKRVPTVGRSEEGQVLGIHDVLVIRIRKNAVEIGRALPKGTFLAAFRPCGSTVVRTKDTATVRFDEGVDAIAIGAGDGDADLAYRCFRQPGILRDLRPRVTAVRRLEETAAGSVACTRRPGGQDAVLPDGREQDVGILPIHRQVNRPRTVVAEENFLP